MFMMIRIQPIYCYNKFGFFLNIISPAIYYQYFCFKLFFYSSEFRGAFCSTQQAEMIPV